MGDQEPPVVHHIELCVSDADDTLSRLEKYGFELYCTRNTPICRQLVTKLGSIYFVITERNPSYLGCRSTERPEALTVFCCEHKNEHSVDSVFNVSFAVKDVFRATERIAKYGEVIQPPVTVRDEFGEIVYSIVKSNCGNVCHTLVNTASYNGPFLVGFQAVEQHSSGFCTSDSHGSENNFNINFIDHITFACYSGGSEEVIKFYEKSFGMSRYRITNVDDEHNGLILSDGIGLLLRALEYYRCSETHLVSVPPKKQGRNPNTLMLVVVETLKGQTHCNVDAFLKEHCGPGVEHVALSTTKIQQTVTELICRGINFRNPPVQYYDELKKANQIRALGEDLNALQKLGILLDNEEDASGTPKYLMQIFALPIFDKKTFFFELIQRSGARGLGTGNVIALVRSIREEEKRKASEKKKAMDEEDIANPRKIC